MPTCSGRASLAGWTGASSRVYRLRWLIFAQAAALEIIYGGQLVPVGLMLPILALGATAVIGLALQKTWGLLLTLSLCLVEAGLLALFAWRALQPLSPAAIVDLRGVFALAVALIAVPLVTSVVLLFPYVRPVIAHLRPP